MLALDVKTLHPDLAEATQFLRALTGTGDALVTFQTFDDTAEKSIYKASIVHGSLSQWDGRLAAWNRDRRGIFVTINETDLLGRKVANIKRVRALFVDCDGVTPAQWHALPSIVVLSRAGMHAYWLVSDCGLGEFRACQQRLAKHYGSDPKVNDLPRVMRLPGFWHCKQEPPFQVELVDVTGAKYRTAEVMQGIEALPVRTLPQPGTMPINSAARGRGGKIDWHALDAVAIFRDAGMLGRELEPGKWSVVCPWTNEHTVPDLHGNSGSTVLWARGANGSPTFLCSHAHCNGRFLWHALQAMGATGSVPRRVRHA